MISWLFQFSQPRNCAEQNEMRKKIISILGQVEKSGGQKVQKY